MKIFLLDQAEESLGKYYEAYKYLPTGGTDMRQRANNYGEIIRIMSNLGNYIGQTIRKNERNIIEINIATVEYEILPDKNLIVIQDIYFKNKQPQQRLTYQPVSGNYYFGFMMVKSNKGLFNYIDSNKRLFCKQWFKSATDFKRFPGGEIAAKVFDGYNYYWLHSDGMLHRTTNTSYIPENTLKYIERTVDNVINEMLLETDRKYFGTK
jgi:hypothetical protein